jgi:hypothetical protein
LIFGVKRLEDTPDDKKEFDFDAWEAGPIKPTFGACAKAAIESLAISDDDLRRVFPAFRLESSESRPATRRAF